MGYGNNRKTVKNALGARTDGKLSETKNKIPAIYSILILLGILGVSQSSFAQVLFQDSFDDQSDWSPLQTSETIECKSGSCTTAPAGYSAYRIAGTGACAEANKNTLNISATNHRGSSGKALTYWNEPCATDSGSWGSDGLLRIALVPPVGEAGYEELYVRFYIKFQPDWKWRTDASPQQKLFRVSHYWGGNDFTSFQGGNHHPLFLADLAKWNTAKANIAYQAAYRYENVYYPKSAIPSHSNSDSFYFDTGNYSGTGADFWDSGMMGDGNWHSWEFYVKMNSAVGVPDGIQRFWQDSKLITAVTDLAWSDEGSQVTPRVLWNSVMIGGNNYNYYAGGEQWYAIDDLVISTTYIGPQSIPIDSAALPANPRGLRLQ